MSASLLYDVMVKTLERRDHATELLHRAAQDATAFLNLGETQKATNALLVASEEFQIAAAQYKEAVDNYHLMQMQMRKEKDHGNAAAA